MMRAINAKSSPLRRLFGGGVGAGTGVGVIAGVCVGAEEPLPVTTLDAAVGYDCADETGVLCDVAYVGVEVPVLLLHDCGAVLWPPLEESAAFSAEGGGVEVFTIGSPGEEGVVARGVTLVGLGVMYVAIYSASTG